MWWQKQKDCSVEKGVDTFAVFLGAQTLLFLYVIKYNVRNEGQTETESTSYSKTQTSQINESKANFTDPSYK